MNHPANTQNILRLENLSVGHGQTPVLAGVNLSLESGRFLALLGPNGAGKTTLLRTLARLLPPLAGAASLAGQNLWAMPMGKLARIQAVVLTDRLTPGLLGAWEVAALGRHPFTGFFGRLNAQDRRIVDQALEMVGATHLAARRFERLSDGEKQKIVLARALAQQPRLILLDEPTVHLDLKHRLEVTTILRRLCRTMGVAVVASMHEVDMAARVADQVALIKNGAVIDHGPPERVLSGAAVSGLYDLDGPRYDSRLGVIELGAGGRRGPLFVFPGGGAAAGALKLLHKRDYALCCGVAHQGDIDGHLAQALGARVVMAPPFAAPSAAQQEACRQLIDQAWAVVDSGFAMGQINQANAALLRQAAEGGKPVFSLRPPEEARALLGQAADGVIWCVDELDLAGKLARRAHRGAEDAEAKSDATGRRALAGGGEDEPRVRAQA